jgi:AraC-like DNA-binding protein
MPHSDLNVPVFAARQSIEPQHRGRAASSHSFAAIAFYTSGRACIEQRGQWTLEPGDALIIPAGESHRLVEAQRSDLWGVGFSAPCFTAIDAAGLLEPFERVRAGASAVVRIPSKRHSFVEQLFRELNVSSGESQAVQQSLLTLVLNEIQRAARWDAADTATPKSVVAKSLHFIERHCLRPLGLQEIARAVGRSPTYVTTALTRATGRSAVEWIVAGRMAEARRLLLHSSERVDVIAERIGYADPTHFIRMFRRAHGVTPAAWRRAKAR